MDPELLRVYNQELSYLRELGKEFAEEFPQVASRLSLDGLEVADPYVERLLEGFAFMSARIQRKQDAEYPQLIAHLLETVCPNFMAPVPSAMTAVLKPDLLHPSLGKGYTVPRNTALTCEIPRGQNTKCEFRTAQAVQLWPIEVVDVHYFSHAAELPVHLLPVGRQVRACLRIRLQAHGGIRFDQLAVDRLNFHLSAPADVAYRLYELIGSSSLGSWVLADKESPGAAGWGDQRTVRLSGFDDDQALLPETLRGFSGYRLLQELGAYPRRFLYFDVTQLARRLGPAKTDRLDLVIALSQAMPALEPLVDQRSVALNCTPAVNLFSKRLDRIVPTPAQHEYHAVPDRTRPMDFEVHSIASVAGFGASATGGLPFHPIYTSFQAQAAESHGYFTVRREARRMSLRQVQQGPRSAYIGSEVFLSMVDPKGAPFGENIRQFAVSALVTNRDLPTLLPPAGSTDGASATRWTLDVAGVVQSVDCLDGPSRPVSRSVDGQAGWSLVNLLTLHYLALGGEDPVRAAASLQALLSLFGASHDTAWQRQVQGLVSVQTKSVTRRLPLGGPLTFGSGTRVELEVDEAAFQAGGAYLLGSVLERCLARMASINSFTQTALRSTSRGPIAEWPPRVGQQELL